MYLLDRVLIRSYLKSYLICLISLLTLWIVVDLFTNLEDYTDRHANLSAVLRHIGAYYGYRVAQIFDRLSEAVVLLAATFTVALLQRNNEILPLLSAGVPTRRIVLPVILCACAMLGLIVLNQELVIARIGDCLMNNRNDPSGDDPILVQGAFEPNGIHIDGDLAARKGMVVKRFYVAIPSNVAGSLHHLTAQEAHYVPPKQGQKRSGGWLMTGTTVQAESDSQRHADLELIDPGKYFLRIRAVDFDALTRGPKWYVHASTARLRQELSRPDSRRLADMAVLFHMRLTRPILGVILVVMGLSVILRDQYRNVFLSAGICIALCALFFTAQFACKSLGDNQNISPALAAWLPVLIFGPIAFAMFDAMHT